MRDKKLEEMRQNYENVKIPAQLRERVEAGIRQAKEETQMKKKSKVMVYTGRVLGGAAAAMLVITVMANSGAAIAYAMAKIPVIGAIAEVVTFREYESSENNMEADMKAAGESGGHLDVELDYSVITDSDRLFSIRFDQLLVMASGTQMVKIYHIDKQTGEMIDLGGLFKEGADYVTAVSENIKKQMKERMAADESLVYWVDNEDMAEWNFESIKEDNTFYVNENGKLTIVFDEYQVAPGYMGSVEFEIPTEIVQDLVQEGFLK